MATTNELGITFGEKQALGGRGVLEDRVAVKTFTRTDNFELTIAIVADGIGGENAGERAAQLTIDTFFEVCQNSNETNVPSLLELALDQANREVYEESVRLKKTHKDMGTTAVVVAVRENQLYIANIGDSRAYLIRGQKVLQLTTDHTWGNDMLRLRKRTAAEVAGHPRRDEISRSIGYESTVKVDLEFGPDAKELTGQESLTLQPGDRIVVCSDGLIKPRKDNTKEHYAEPNEIARIVNSSDPQSSADQLVALAESRNVDDNVSVGVLRVLGGSKVNDGMAIGQSLLRSRAVLISAGMLVLATLCIVLGAGVWNVISGPATPPPQPSPTPLQDIEANFAIVTAIEGIAQYSPLGAASNNLHVGDSVAADQGALVRIPNTGRLRLQLSDGTLAFLDSNTEIELRHIASHVGDETVIQLNHGALLVNATLQPGFKFHVQNSSGVQANVTGTLMCLHYDQAQQFDLDCLAGHCALNVKGFAQNLITGQHSFVIGLGNPSNPDSARNELCQFGEGVATPTALPPTPTVCAYNGCSPMGIAPADGQTRETDSGSARWWVISLAGYLVVGLAWLFSHTRLSFSWCQLLGDRKILVRLLSLLVQLLGVGLIVWASLRAFAY